MKAKLYKGAALVFFLLGLVLFFVFSIVMTNGDFEAFFRKPLLLLLLVVPFLPTYVFIMLSDKKRKLVLKARQSEKSH